MGWTKVEPAEKRVEEEAMLREPEQVGTGGLPAGDDREVRRAGAQEIVPAAAEAVNDPDLEDVGVPPGMVLRYCGVIKTFYFADPAESFCLCGHRIGSV
jgi:hypothetical protein